MKKTVNTKKKKDSFESGSDIPSEYREDESSQEEEEIIDSVEMEELLTQAQNGWIGFNHYTSQNMASSPPTFQGTAGITADLSQLNEPIEFFELFLDDKFLDDVCQKTHQYYNSNAGKSKKTRDSHERGWSRPDVIEMKAFLGVILFTGIVKKPNLRDYWSESFLFGSPGIVRIFSRDHFFNLKRNLHFVNENQANKDDPLYKIRPLINQIISVSQKLYSPAQYFTIDESMIRFSGRSKFKVYMPLKPVKYGFKAYLLTEADSGYVFKWNLHEGTKKKEKKTSLKPLQQIVFSLVEDYKNRGHIIWVKLKNEFVFDILRMVIFFKD